MKAARFIPAISWTFAVGVGLFCFSHCQNSRGVENEFRATIERRQALQARLRELRPAIVRLENDRKFLTDAIATEKESMALAKMKHAAEKERRMMRVLHASLSLSEPHLYRTLHLTPDQITIYNRIKQALIRRDQDIADTVVANNLKQTDPAIMALANEEIAQYHRELTEALGQPIAGQIIEYQRTAFVRGIASSIAGQTSVTDVPLTSGQADALTQILANNSPSYQKGSTALPTGIAVEPTLAQAQSLLTPVQLAALKSYLQGMAGAAIFFPVLQSAAKPRG